MHKNKIALKSLEAAFRADRVRGVTIIGVSEKDWRLAINIADPKTGTQATYSLKTTRNGERNWADPRSLFGFIRNRFGVHSGQFEIEEVSPNEAEERASDEDGQGRQDRGPLHRAGGYAGARGDAGPR